jgi:hypothetical protein
MDAMGEQTAFVYTTYIQETPAVLASLKTLLETGSSLRTS